MAIAAEEFEPAGIRPTRSRFHVWIAAACVAIAFVGFAPTYWLPIATGTLTGFKPVVHLHGLVFFCWPVFFLYQSWLVASGRTARHRSVGLIGVSLATAMLIFGVAAGINSAQVAEANGFGDAGRQLLIVPLSTILTFAVLVALAIANVRRPEVHRRLLTVASVSIVAPAVARLFLVALGIDRSAGSPPPPIAAALVPALVIDLLLVAAVVYDWRSEGRVHPAYKWSIGAVVAGQILRVPFGHTEMWQSIASAIVRLGG